eukprot:1046425-Rhodomonas_salina.4
MRCWFPTKRRVAQDPQLHENDALDQNHNLPPREPAVAGLAPGYARRAGGQIGAVMRVHGAAMQHWNAHRHIAVEYAVPESN